MSNQLSREEKVQYPHLAWRKTGKQSGKWYYRHVVPVGLRKILGRREITDAHLIAYRMSKEEILKNWLLYLKMVVKAYFSNLGRMIDDEVIFQTQFDEQLWINIKNFVQNLSQLPLWKDRSMASTIFSGKQNYGYWEEIFRTGRSKDGVRVLAKPLNFMEMIVRHERLD